MVDAAKGLGNGGGVGNHADGALDGGDITTGHVLGGLVVDAALEAGGTPVDELDGALGLDSGDGEVDVLGDDIATVHEAAGHVLAVAGVTLGHHGGGLEDGVGDLGDGKLLVVGLLGGDDGGVGGEHEVDARVGDEVGLELSNVDVESAVETEGCGQRGDDLSDETVEVGVGGTLNVKVTTAHIVQSLVVKAEGTVGVLEQCMGRQDGVVGLNDGRGDLRRGTDGKGKLGLAAVINAQALEEERAKTGTGTTASSVEDEEALKAGAVVSKLADAVKDLVDNLLADGVVTAGVVVGGLYKFTK